MIYSPRLEGSAPTISSERTGRVIQRTLAPPRIANLARAESSERQPGEGAAPRQLGKPATSPFL